MSTTGPVIWITLPVAVGAAVAMCRVSLLVVRVGSRQRAWAPDEISIISRVMFAWRTLL